MFPTKSTPTSTMSGTLSSIEHHSRAAISISRNACASLAVFNKLSETIVVEVKYIQLNIKGPLFLPFVSIQLKNGNLFVSLYIGVIIRFIDKKICEEYGLPMEIA